ncbi:hypothetical protein F4820DRAFT_423042 [Hypoxylon rubiginosum]|uniref:Uncharacterized protein n=1 Tax=Hypoxylon rubiginosum TaxID=110542 RepID=A0ACB9YZ10_9PEZI|nr:hypothetical protein F4820DRAFT_423042 [Hypoxylon rubiginosum]
MKFLSLVGFGLLASGIHASATADHRHDATLPPIYILKSTPPAMTSLGKALDTLGYISVDTQSGLSNQTSSAYTYVEISSETQLLEVARSHPEAKFIVPRGRPRSRGRGDWSRMCAAWWIGGTCYDQKSLELIDDEDHIQQALTYFPEEKRRHVFLLDVFSRDPATQAENWINLCQFLGMGYSTVERLKLWHFPE